MNIWVSGCCHVPRDEKHGRESLAEAIRQSEGREANAPGFDWDFGVILGDFAAAMDGPEDWEGELITKQFGEMQKHRREDVYTLAGNHDASAEPTKAEKPEMWWFRKWLDPMGENTATSGVNPANRPYPVSGTWERYSFEVGNMLFLMMADRNDLPPPIGRFGTRGGYPAGAVSRETFEWWKEMVSTNTDKIIFSAHHHMLRETTVASGKSEGTWKDPDGTLHQVFHSWNPGDAHEGASYLYFVGDEPDAQAFEKYLEEHPGATDVWLGGHTHSDPDTVVNGRGPTETKWGTHFINAAGLTAHHGKRCRKQIPSSRLLSLTEGSDELRVQYYLHTDDHAPVGFYPKNERILKLSKPFTMG